MFLNSFTVLFFGLVWLGIILFLWLKKKKGLTYLILFTFFFIYLFKVLDYTLLQFQSLLFLKLFVPNLILNGQKAGETTNFVPLFTLTSQDLKTSLLNILLFVPFGFGMPFFTKLNIKKIVVFGLLFSTVIELLQLTTGVIAGITFRIADINDVIFNTLGATLGYVLFVGVVRAYRHISAKG